MLKAKDVKSITVIAAIAIMAFFVCARAFADVWVPGYYRSDGTRVRGHYRSSPNQYKWDNYGPSKSDNELINPRSRDYDGDGTPNYLDYDDDNDGYSDDYDSSQYGSGW